MEDLMTRFSEIRSSFSSPLTHHVGLNKISKTRQEMYYTVILRGVHTTTVKVEKQ
jgi:hypothetical protein